MARIRINDLPGMAELSPEEMQQLFGAGLRDTFRPSVESLEAREMYAINVTSAAMPLSLNTNLSSQVLLPNQTLRIEGTAHNDQITLGVTAGHLTVNQNLFSQLGATNLKHILINTHGGADQVNLRNFPWSNVEIVIDEGSSDISLTGAKAPVYVLENGSLLQVAPNGTQSVIASNIGSWLVLDNGDVWMLGNQQAPNSPGNYPVSYFDGARRQLVTTNGAAAALTQGPDGKAWLISANNHVSFWNPTSHVFQQINSGSLSTTVNNGELFARAPGSTIIVERNGTRWQTAPSIQVGTDSWLLGFRTGGGSAIYRWNAKSFTEAPGKASTLIQGFGNVPWIIRADGPTAGSFCQWNGNDWTVQVEANRMTSGGVPISYHAVEAINGQITVAVWHFSNGIDHAKDSDIVWCRDTPATYDKFHVFNDATLFTKWRTLRSTTSNLGLPLGDSLSLVGAKGVKVQNFQNGVIVHTVAQGTHLAGTYALQTTIASAWLDLRNSEAFGLPISDAMVANVTGQAGWIMGNFTGPSHAHIFAHNTGRAGPLKWEVFSLSGSISARWDALRGTALWPGMPTSNVTAAWVSGDQIAHFQKGDIYWNQTKAVVILAPVVQALKAFPGNPAATVGRPLQDSLKRANGSIVSTFQYVTVYISATGQVQYLKPTDAIPVA